MPHPCGSATWKWPSSRDRTPRLSLVARRYKPPLLPFLSSDPSDANQKRAGAHQHDRAGFRAGGGRIDYKCLCPPPPAYIFQEENFAKIEVIVRRSSQQVQIVLHAARNGIRASREHVPDVVLKIDLILR